MNIFIIVGFLIIVFLLNMVMFLSKDEIVEVDLKLLVELEEVVMDILKMILVERVENSSVVFILFLIMGFVYIGYYLKIKGFVLNFNLVNFIFLFLGILLYGILRRYLNVLVEVIKGVGGILL